MTSDKYKKYYETLGLNSGASKEEINKAFRELAHIYHPDNVFGKSENVQEIAANKFKEISVARKILSEYLSDDAEHTKYEDDEHVEEDDTEYPNTEVEEDDDEYTEEDDDTEYSEEHVNRNSVKFPLKALCPIVDKP